MKRGSRYFLLLLASVAMLFALPAGAADPAKKPIKNIMAENLGFMQEILIDLMTAQYAKLLPAADLVRDHAVRISENRPKEITGQVDIDRFNAYAFTLRNSTEHLILVTKELIRHDKEPQTPGLLNIDYLRVVVAGHYSNMVTTCVNCHNQFRRKPVTLPR